MKRGVKQTNNVATKEDIRYCLSGVGEILLVSSDNILTLLECTLREQEHLKRENGNEMEKYLLLANQQCI